MQNNLHTYIQTYKVNTHTYVHTCISICLSSKSNKFIAHFIMHKNIIFIHANPVKATATFPYLINVCLKIKGKKEKKKQIIK